MLYIIYKLTLVVLMAALIEYTILNWKMLFSKAEFVRIQYKGSNKGIANIFSGFASTSNEKLEHISYHMGLEARGWMENQTSGNFYFTREGINTIACPMLLWWLLRNPWDVFRLKVTTKSDTPDLVGKYQAVFLKGQG